MSLENPTNREDGAEKFYFEKGKLYIRRISGENGTDDVLHYEMSDKEWHMKTIGESKNVKFTPYYSSWYEGSKEKTGRSRSGNKIEHIPATDDYLKEYMKTFESKSEVSLKEWVDEVCEATDLDEEEKKRIRRIASEIETYKQES